MKLVRKISVDTTDLIFKRDNLTHPAVIELVKYHMKTTVENAEEAHPSFLNIESLQKPDVYLWTAWVGDELCGMGGFKVFGDRMAELKSFHTVSAFRSIGIGGKLLDYIIKEAKSMGLNALFLGTGASDYYAPAVKLYRSRGFEITEPFGKYKDDPFSYFFKLILR